MSSAHDDRGLLRFTTCGSVDDGKSTLIGRLLYDTRAILADTLHAMERTSRKRGLDAVDLSLLTDGLQAEREQGITIDVAYRYFSTGLRKYIIADAPGHAQYTRNMVTAASTADLAILLLDARKGVLTQTRRHAYITRLLGVRHVVAAVNKMDLVGYDPAVFERIRAEFVAFATSIGLDDVRVLPLSALQGDMVVDRGTTMPWYDGPTLLDLLESTPAAEPGSLEALRFPVQWVCRVHDEGLGGASAGAVDAARAGAGYRGFAGRVEAGAVRVGDRVCVLPAGRAVGIRDVQLGGVSVGEATVGQSVTLVLDEEVDVSRGDMIVAEQAAPTGRRTLEAMLCWLAEAPLDRSRRYIVRHTTAESRGLVGEIAYRIDVDTGAHVAADTLRMNDIARVSLKLARPLLADTYDACRATGSFVVVDESTNNTVGAGMIVSD